MIPGLLLLGVSAVGMLARGWLRRRDRRQAAALLDSRHCIAVCFRLIDLLSLLQQHRGLSGAWLAGHRQFEACMLQKRAEVEAVLADLAPSGCGPRDMSDFRSKWLDIVGSIANYSVEHSFARQSCLIEVVLHWLASSGERCVAARDAGRRDAAEDAANFFQRLPLLAECLAQARGIGAAVAIRSGCSSVARVRLLFLIGRAESLLRQIGANDQDTECPARHSVVTMAQLVRRKMLLSSGVLVSADAYFATTSHTIDAILDWARACGARLESRIEHPTPHAYEPTPCPRGT